MTINNPLYTWRFQFNVFVYILLLMVVVGNGFATDKVVAEWDFTEGDCLGWGNEAGMGPLVVSGGVLSATVNAADAFFNQVGLCLDTGTVSHLLVRMRTSCPGTTQVYFSTSENPDPAVNGVPGFYSTGGETFHEYSVALEGREGWKGTMGMLRLDPINGLGMGGRFEIDWIRLVSRSPEPAWVNLSADRVTAPDDGESTLIVVAVKNAGGGNLSGLRVLARDPSGLIMAESTLEQATGNYQTSLSLTGSSSFPSTCQLEIRSISQEAGSPALLVGEKSFLPQ